jgi:hypothetical protein
MTPHRPRRERVVRGAGGVVVAALLATMGTACAAEPPIRGIEEPSGVTRHGDELLVVGDDEPGCYYSLPVTGSESTFIPLAPARLRRHPLASGTAAFDLEAIDVLADGRVVALSERLPGLFDENGLVVAYGKSFVSVGGRGPEGLAILPQDDGSSRVAVLWEGGYPEKDKLPPELADQELPAFRPRVLLHRLPGGATDFALGPEDVEAEVELAVPVPPGREPFAQRFRAPDLVWHRLTVGGKEEWGWIVLMSSGWDQPPAPGSEEECAKSENGKPLRWCNRILQRFTTDGQAVGDPFDLDDVLPEALRTANWEGLGWLVPGKKLVMVYDEPLAEKRIDPQQALVVALPKGW